jgi:hypothetical protein
MKIYLLLILSIFAAFHCACAEPAAPEQPWQKRCRERLAKDVTFELVETPLDDALTFITGLSQLTFVIDPRRADNLPQVSGRAKNQPLGKALAEMLATADLEYQVLDGAVFVHGKGAQTTAATTGGPLNDAQATALQAAIADLGADKYELREAANKRIMETGPAAVPLLEKLAKSTPDPEVQLRARKLLENLNGSRMFEEPADVAAMLNSLQREFSEEYFETPAADVLESIRPRIARDGADPAWTSPSGSAPSRCRSSTCPRATPSAGWRASAAAR